MITSKPTLWHIPVSHYSEKARWALAHKSVEHERRMAPPGGHMAVSLWLTRGHSVTFPVLELDGRRYGDSTALIAALEQRFPEPPLYPADPDERRRALELEDWFDEELGPHMRRFAFHQMRQDRELFAQAAARTSPDYVARLGPVAPLFARAFTALRYAAGSSAQAERSRRRVLAALDRLDAELGDNDYLVGHSFTVADLTAAALFYPLVLPPEAPGVVDRVPQPYERFREPLRERRGYRWVEDMFRRHRHEHKSPAKAGAV